MIIVYEVENHIARITLNRPDKRNALNDELINALKTALRRAESETGVRVVVIAGAGADFCSGADLSALQKIAQANVLENLEDAAGLLELFALIRRLRLPVVALVRGRALAGGCGLATACDLVLAARSARFGYPEVKIGFVPALVTAIMRRNVSEKRAFELITRGTEISADEAERLGLINQVYEDEVFAEAAAAYLQAYGKISASAVQLSKRLLYQMDGLTFEAALQAGADVNTLARMTPDCQQGIARFLNKAETRT